ncbi:MAG: redox-regulated ATPase YchF [Candidatus Micrarchaeota archaeon]|nr:redox-regulated ATPase YchF [Candidatus Micrarchaeota archaeon]
MLIGIVGAPNKGKSTLFSALTMSEVEIADYPFTTINPNLGVAYATKECAERSLHVKCRPRNSLCVDGTRLIPVNIVDVAGLVEGAHHGKGMGNQFLNDLAAADALMLVVDASGKTDANGNPSENSNPVDDVRLVRNELVEWLSSIIKRHMPQLSRRPNGTDALSEILAGLKVSKDEIKNAAESNFLTTSNIAWPDADIRKFSEALLNRSKPILLLANKSDAPGSAERVQLLEKQFGKDNVVSCSAAIELALRKAAKHGIIDYHPGATDFKILKDELPKEQADALKYMKTFVGKGGTGVQNAINRVLFKLLDDIVVYPVEDDGKYSDHSGNVLPDAIPIKKGSTALDLAAKIHTDIASGMLYAIDARTKMRLAKDYVLKDGDVIKIVTAAKPK